MASAEVEAPPQARKPSIIKIKGGSGETEARNSFCADSPYYNTYVESELRTMGVMHDTLKDIAGRTKTFGKCGALMAESTKRLALACRLRRPVNMEEGKEAEIQEQQMEQDVAERRQALGEEMASLLVVMSEVSRQASCTFSLRITDSL